MAEVFDFDGAGERYKFLLQPLKDLASNWDVDIAKTLEEYIQKVVEENDSAVLVDQNGRRKVFNFTEAALLIHGTTSVYVKKVDYVHQLALNFFDQLREDPQPDKKRKKANQPDNEDVDQVEDNVENGSGMEEILVPKEKQKLKVNFAAMHTLLERLTHRQAPSFPLVPISFIPLSDHEKSDVPLFTRTNAKEQIGKKDDFRINSCHIYESVALLDIKNISMVDKITPFHKHDFQTIVECTLQTRHSSPQQSLDPILDHPNDEDDGEEEFIQQQQKENINANDEGIVPFNGDEEDEFEGGMEEIIADEEILPPVDDNITFVGGDDDNVYLDPQDVIKEQSRPYKKKLNCIINADKQIKARERRIERECKEKGVPNECSIKNYIDSQMFRKRLRKRNFVFGQFNAFLMDQAVLALNPLIYEEEKRRNDFRKKKRKENQAIERALRARHRSSQQSLDPVLDHPNDEDDGEEEFIQQQQKENINANNEGIVPFNGDEEDEFEDGMEEIIADEILPAMDDNMTFGGDDDNETNLGDILELDDLQNSLGGIQNMYSGFQHLISSKIRDKNALASKLAKNMRNDYDDTRIECDLNPEDLPNRPPSQMNYDEIIAFHLRKYWTSSEAAVSKFSERMQMWEAKMGLALEEERKHREFDTREYGDEVVNFFDGKIGNEVDFTQVLGSIPNGYDRSRYLLVTLILANMGNLEINVADNSSNNESQMLNYSLEMATSPAYSEKMDHIHLKLLKLERHHQVFEDEQRLLNGNPQN